MQMRERKYIRFDFTQASHRRATRAEHRDYRIIARTQPSDPSSTRALAHAVHSVATARAFRAGRFCPSADAARSIPDSPIYCPDLRDSRLLVRRQFIALADPALRA